MKTLLLCFLFTLFLCQSAFAGPAYPFPVAKGGTGAKTFTSNAILMGNGSSAIGAAPGITYAGVQGRLELLGPGASQTGAFLESISNGVMSLANSDGPIYFYASTGIGVGQTYVGEWNTSGVSVGTGGSTSPTINLNTTNAAGAGTETFIEASGGGHYNWLLGAQYNVNNGFEITPSTATDGTTFSTPGFWVDHSGNIGTPAVLYLGASSNAAGGLMLKKVTSPLNAFFAGDSGQTTTYVFGLESGSQTGYLGVYSNNTLQIYNSTGGTGRPVVVSGGAPTNGLMIVRGGQTTAPGVGVFLWNRYGEGYTCARNTNGQFTITFSPSFNSGDVPSCTCSVNTSTSDLVTCIINGTPSNSAVSINTINGSGAADLLFSFVCIGERPSGS